MTWEDIKIKHYVRIMDLNEDSFEDQLKSIGIIKDLSLEEIRKVPSHKIAEWSAEIKQLGLSEIPSKLVKKWEGYKISHKLKDVTAGQMIDYDLLREQGNELKNLHKFMSVLSNPKDEEEFEERANHFWDNMPIGVAYGVHVFFCNLHSQYEKSIKDSLKVTERVTHSRSIGGGMRLSMYFQTATQSLKKRWYR